MSVNYQPVIWNRQKKIYDLVLLGFVVFYLVLFSGFQLVMYPEITIETLIIRATATLALLMLHVLLMIGPLCRMSPRFLPLLYNRRHLGVSMFLIALVHSLFSIIQFHALGDVNPLVSIFTSNIHYASVSRFPFQTLGFFALIILFLMAATSHDFWLKNLGPRIWKSLHMMVYFAYSLIILHVMLGVLQFESSPVLAGLLGVGMITIISLHLAAAFQEARREQWVEHSGPEGLVKVCPVADIPEDRAKVILAGSENIAIFKYNGKLSAVSNICKHQNGPLGEGKIVDGCITCPWHGYQYLPGNGQSPPPFKETLATFTVEVVDGMVYVDPRPHPEGTAVTPAVV